MKNYSVRSCLYSVLCVALVLLFGNGLVFAQVCEQLRADIINTGMMQCPLPLDHSRSFETFGLTKTVLQSDMVCDMQDLRRWRHTGSGSMTQTSERGVHGDYSMRLTAPTRSGAGASRVTLDLGGVNLENYNRIKFWIYPDSPVRGAVYMNFTIWNQGEITIPDEWSRMGLHEIHMVNRQWNEAFVEISELPRDNVTRIQLSISVPGRELTMGEYQQFDIGGIALQVIENPEVQRGWTPAENRIIYSTTGYGIDSRKMAIVNVANHNGTFRLLDDNTNQVVFTGSVNSIESHIGSFDTIDFSDFQTEGRFVINVGDVTTQPFFINRNIWDDSAWRVLNFIFTQRCGFPVPGRHSACHFDHSGIHNNARWVQNGGWHDAGDLSQNPKQTAEVVMALFELANNQKAKGNDQFYLRINQEALWGLDYILRARLGDGYRVARAMHSIWTDNLIGTADDSRRVHVRNGAWENFIYAAVIAYASMSIGQDTISIDRDVILQEATKRIAIYSSSATAGRVRVSS